MAAGLTRARDEFGGESILPYSYMGTQGLIQGDVMSARVMNALGATGWSGRSAPPPGSPASAPRTGISPEVDPEEWPHARYVLVWGWNPMSTAPHLWRKLLDARARPARGSSWWIRSAAAPRGWPTSTSARCPAPTPRWRWG